LEQIVFSSLSAAASAAKQIRLRLNGWTYQNRCPKEQWCRIMHIYFRRVYLQTCWDNLR
jgi:hypothetical protein